MWDGRTDRRTIYRKLTNMKTLYLFIVNKHNAGSTYVLRICK